MFFRDSKVAAKQRVSGGRAKAISYLALLVLASSAFAGSRADPSTWILWRAAPIEFPATITPEVPEMMQGEPLIDFTKNGSDLTIVMPDGLGDDYDSKALDWAKRYVIDKAKKARVALSSKVSAADLRHHVLCLGTLQNNAFAAKLAGRGFLDGITPGGYRIKTVDHPTDKSKRVILALGADMKGAYSAGAVLCHAIHPNKGGVNQLKGWPVKVPPGCYWIPFEAKAAPPVAGYEKTAFPDPAPPKPRVPFGLRVWGSPMPDLTSYQRLVRALKPTGINTIVVQSGGLVDLPDAAPRFVSLLDIAWQEGIYTCLYVGNDEESHYSAPLTENHKAVVLATKDHPGLLAFHVYNQLGTKDSPEQYKDLERQVRWIDACGKPTSVEVVIGHNSIDVPPDKAKLMRDLKSWGIDVIGTDYAPIGGWSKKPDLTRWETKMLAFRPYEDKTEVLLQAHVPFVGATVPSKEQVRNQFWWALAGGVHGYFVEAAYIYDHMSMRGLVGWDCKPLPDGRYDAVTEIAADSQKMAEFITEAEIVKPEEVGLSFAERNESLHLRARKKADDTLFALVINEDLGKEHGAKLSVKEGAAYQVTDVLAGTDRGRFDASRNMVMNVPVGGAVCLKLQPVGGKIPADGDAGPKGVPPGKRYIYKTTDGEPQDLEVYFPKDWNPAKNHVPGVMLFHGGAWGHGDLSSFRYACQYLASRGIVAATANYKLITYEAYEALVAQKKSPLPPGASRKRIGIIDARSAIRWMKQHAAELGVDPDRIIVGGGSAGGHLAVLSTINTDLNDPADPRGIDTKAVAYLLFGPAFTPPGNEADSQVDVFPLLKPGLAPAIMFFGSADTRFKPPADELVKRIKANGDETAMWIAKGQPHAFESKQPWYDLTLIEVDRFLVAHGLLQGPCTLTLPAGVEKLEPR